VIWRALFPTDQFREYSVTRVSFGSAETVSERFRLTVMECCTTGTATNMMRMSEKPRINAVFI
jgi:hypothetical protein